MQVNEIDVIRQCSKNPKFTYHLQKDTVGRILYKVWSGVTKFIRNFLNNGRGVYSSDIGRFYIQDNRIAFCPSAQLIKLGNFTTFNQQQGQDKNYDQHLSYNAIAQVVGIDRETVYKALKDILYLATEMAKQGKTVKLNFKIGFLTLTSSKVEFNGGPGSRGLNSSMDASRIASSVRTPRTSQCSVYRPQSQVSQTYHPSNPNPVLQGVSQNLSNYYRGLRQQRQAETIPIPKMFHKGYGGVWGYTFRNNFTKRQACDLPVTAEQLLQAHREQMGYKKQKQIQEKQQSNMEEIEQIKGINDRIKNEAQNAMKVQQQRNKELLEYNLAQAQDKSIQKENERINKMKETYDYFPFTHGYQIEEQQAQHRQNLAQELKEYYQNLSQATKNYKQSEMPQTYTTQFPSFLKSTEYHQVRRMDNRHVEETMNQALLAYEQQLKHCEDEKKHYEELERQQLQEADDYYEQQLRSKCQNQQKHKKALEKQIKEKKQQKQEDFIENKRFTRTHFGPEDVYEDDQYALEKIQQEKQQMREELRKQMKQKHNNWRRTQEKERQIDQDNIANATEYIAAEQEKQDFIEKENKKLYREVWINQQRMKEEEKKVGKVL